MADAKPSQGQATSITDEFVELGRNIQKALEAAWASEERIKLQAEIEAGLKEANKALKQAADDFSQSQAGQTLKVETEGLQKRLQSGEVEAKIRSDLLSALRMANEELKKAFSGRPAPGGAPAQPSDKPGDKE
jgi:CII-binding regulator of phage lambda lysogenization HflD